MISSISGALARKRTALGEKEKGFTLIELLVVVLIIGVLAAVAIPIFLGQQEGAKDQAVSASVTNAKTAVAAALSSGDPLTDTPTKVKTILDAGTNLNGYTPSADVKIKMTAATATTFTIEGWWTKSDTAATGALATNHGYKITEATAATKIP
jgi:prepilin-type N-terminal cleavage/methylation domain-containing protein